MKFSERKGYREVSQILQKEFVNEDLRIAVWNIFYSLKFNKTYFANNGWVVDAPQNNYSADSIGKFSQRFWMFYEMPLDKRPSSCNEVIREFRRHLLDLNWYDFYDFIEFSLNYFDDTSIIMSVNNALEKYLSAYRFINNVIVEITDTQEIEMLEEVLTDEDFPNVNIHLKRALELLSDRKTPDYRNSIKESISAVESIAKEIVKKPDAELGKALAELEKSGKIHRALKSSYLNLYGYTSGADGIRHALMEEPNLTADDAKFFLLTCTSFINYLKSKM